MHLAKEGGKRWSTIVNKKALFIMLRTGHDHRKDPVIGLGGGGEEEAAHLRGRWEGRLLPFTEAKRKGLFDAAKTLPPVGAYLQR